MTAALRCDKLVKKYGQLTAVDELDLEVTLPFRSRAGIAQPQWVVGVVRALRLPHQDL